MIKRVFYNLDHGDNDNAGSSSSSDDSVGEAASPEVGQGSEEGTDVGESDGIEEGHSGIENQEPCASEYEPEKPSLSEFSEDCVIQRKSVFKCKLCPRILCLNVDMMKRHLSSKGHARSRKKFSEGRLRLMLNSDGELEEEAETHAERYARIVAIASEPPKEPKSKKRHKKRKYNPNKREKTKERN
eukprot:TRINITY_DN6032_c0_g1_i1.p1 TRINITY_DN6032_c0_g1~~TRINITY_DN6032_c0_g1_i1.p1  ORF type:complete len:186 (-),score=24.30 TRINITY_DN6032_c0_g1_i1:308-865(-)